MEVETYPYQKEWEEYISRAKIFWRTFFVFVPIPLTIFLRFIFNFNDIKSRNIAIAAFSVYIIVCIITGYRLFYWKCPNCEKPFLKNPLNFIVSRSCQNCSLMRFRGSNLERPK